MPRSRSTTAEAEIVECFETGYYPSASGKPMLVRAGERRPADDPDVLASAGAWFADGRRSEYVQARREHEEEVARRNAPPPPEPPPGFNEWVRATRDFQFADAHPFTHERITRVFRVGDTTRKSDSAFQLYGKSAFEDCPAPEEE
jgi:hypothetical protein